VILARRIVSILLYIAAGLFLISWGVISFVDEPGVSKSATMAAAAPWALIPLAIGLAISPGNRLRDAGIVLLFSGIWAGIAAAMVFQAMAMPESRAMLPPDQLRTLEMFSDVAFGSAFTLAMTGLGLALLVIGLRRRPAAEGRAENAPPPPPLEPHSPL
jgi:hypothetical protein